MSFTGALKDIQYIAENYGVLIKFFTEFFNVSSSFVPTAMCCVDIKVHNDTYTCKHQYFLGQTVS